MLYNGLSMYNLLLFIQSVRVYKAQLCPGPTPCGKCGCPKFVARHHGFALSKFRDEQTLIPLK